MGGIRPGDPGACRARTTALALGATLLAAALLRLAVCGRYVFMDESITLGGTVFHFFKDRTLLPNVFWYPTGFGYLAAIPTGLGAVLLWLAGVTAQPAEIAALFALDSTLPVLPARLLSVAFGVATVALVHRVGAEAWGRGAGLSAALVLALSPLHVDRSAYGLPDAAAAFWVTLSLALSLRALETGAPRAFALAGLAAGIAVDTKYNAGMVGACGLAAALLAGRGAAVSLAHYGAGGIAGFVLASPGWLVQPLAYWRTLRLQADIMAGGHPGAFGAPILRHLELAWTSETTLALALALGLALACARRDPRDRVILALVLPSVLVIGCFGKKSLHYLLFVWPALALLAGRAAAEIHARAGERGRQRALAFGLGLALLAWPAERATRFALAQLRTDARVESARWIESHVPPGARVLADWAHVPKLLDAREKARLRAAGYVSEEFYRAHIEPRPAYALEGFPLDPHTLDATDAEWLVTSSYAFRRYFENPAPPPGHPMAGTHQRAQAFYATLLGAPSHPRWRIERRFATGKGPEVVVARRLLHGRARLF